MAQIISDLSQMCDLEGDQVNVCIHGPCDLFRRIVVGIDIIQQFVIVQQNLCRHDIGLILRACAHVVKHMYEAAVSLKTARQRNTYKKENDAITLLRDLVRCDCCGHPMKRRISTKHRIRESWNCTNDECGNRVRISDAQLLETITVLINRIILNNHLLQPKPRKRYEPDVQVTKIGNEIALELEQDEPNEDFVIQKTIEMASLMYEQSSAKLDLAVSIAKKLAQSMVTQDEFNPDYFSALVAYITLGAQGRVVLYTKTETEVTMDDGSN